MQQLVTPAKTSDVAALIGKLALHYSLGHEASNLKHLIADYIEDLSPYPSWAIDAACKAYRRNADSKFFPKIGELIGLAEKEVREPRRELSLIERLIAEVEGEQRVKLEVSKPRDEDFAALIAMLRDSKQPKEEA